MPLKKDQVTIVAGLAPTTEKMIEGNLVECSRRSERRNVSSNSGNLIVGAHDHRHRIPTDDTLQPTLNFTITWIRLLLVYVNGIDVGRI